jgi:hypothetical protein
VKVDGSAAGGTSRARTALAFALLALAACSSADDTTTDAGDASTDALGAPDASTTIDVPATQATWTVAEDVSFDGTGAAELGAIAITHGVGTIQFHGETTPAFFYTSTSTPPGTGDGGAFTGERDFEIVGMTPDRAVLAWITCANDTNLAFVYYESTDGIASTAELPAKGTCSSVTQSTDESVSLPAMSIPPPKVVSGFTISGPSIAFDGANPGTATFASTSWTLYPFNVIDCTTCASPGWFELHSLFWEPSTQTISLAIIYLEQASPNSVALAYLVRLPQLDDPIGQRLDLPATWTTP